MYEFALVYIFYSRPRKKVYTFAEPSTQNWGGPDGKYGVRQTLHPSELF